MRLLDARNINAGLNGVYPFGDAAIRLLTESAGFSRLNQFVVSPSMNYKKWVTSGFFALSYGKDNTSCEPTANYSPAGCAPADPYNRRAEWGPSRYGDVRHRMVLMSIVRLPKGLSVIPFLITKTG